MNPTMVLVQKLREHVTANNSFEAVGVPSLPALSCPSFIDCLFHCLFWLNVCFVGVVLPF